MMPGGEALHRRSIRLPAYDYAQPGAYFVTMVTAGRQCLFGQIVDGKMQLSALGQIARQQWLRLPARFACLELGAYVVMPNHVHAILIIHEHRGGTAGNPGDLVDPPARRAPTVGGLVDYRSSTAGRSVDDGVQIPRRAATFPHTAEAFGKPVPHSIPTIVRSYKSAVTYRIHLVRGSPKTPVWQRNYYEHIIRNQREWERMHLYIDSNPAHWSQDKDHPSTCL